MKKTLIIAGMAVAFLAGIAGASGGDDMSENGGYAVVWDSPSKDSRGSMPIGNGDIGANVWVEPTGDVVFYISKTDAWSENARLLKLGKVRVTCDPPLYAEGMAFKQELDLANGLIRIQCRNDNRQVAITFRVDANHPTVFLTAEASAGMTITATSEPWRTARRELTGTELPSAYGLHGAGGPRVFVEPDTVVTGRFIRYYWQGGLELALMMLDTYAHTQDRAFVRETLLPLASEILTFFDQHWKRDESGKIRFDPAMALETYAVAVNPLVEIVGIRKVCESLLALPEAITTPGQRAQWKRLIGELPPVPTRTVNGQTLLAPAEQYSGKQNVENPELYAIFPYRVYGVGKPDLDLALRSFAGRAVKETGGWQQNAIKAACLGLADEAAKLVGRNFSTKSAQHRFPAMWGPNYDWTPDQCHGGVAMIALQQMLMQCEGDALYLLPAWPQEWDADFRLHAPGQTTIQGRVQDGKLIALTVSPESRRKDIQICEPFNSGNNEELPLK